MFLLGLLWHGGPFAGSMWNRGRYQLRWEHSPPYGAGPRVPVSIPVICNTCVNRFPFLCPFHFVPLSPETSGNNEVPEMETGHTNTLATCFYFWRVLILTHSRVFHSRTSIISGYTVMFVYTYTHHKPWRVLYQHKQSLDVCQISGYTVMCVYTYVLQT